MDSLLNLIELKDNKYILDIDSLRLMHENAKYCDSIALISIVEPLGQQNQLLLNCLIDCLNCDNKNLWPQNFEQRLCVCCGLNQKTPSVKLLRQPIVLRDRFSENSSSSSSSSNSIAVFILIAHNLSEHKAVQDIVGLFSRISSTMVYCKSCEVNFEDLNIIGESYSKLNNTCDDSIKNCEQLLILINKLSEDSSNNNSNEIENFPKNNFDLTAIKKYFTDDVDYYLISTEHNNNNNNNKELSETVFTQIDEAFSNEIKNLVTNKLLNADKIRVKTKIDSSKSITANELIKLFDSTVRKLNESSLDYSSRNLRQIRTINKSIETNNNDNNNELKPVMIDNNHTFLRPKLKPIPAKRTVKTKSNPNKQQNENLIIISDSNNIIDKKGSSSDDAKNMPANNGDQNSCWFKEFDKTNEMELAIPLSPSLAYDFMSNKPIKSGSNSPLKQQTFRIYFPVNNNSVKYGRQNSSNSAENNLNSVSTEDTTTKQRTNFDANNNLCADNNTTNNDDHMKLKPVPMKRNVVLRHSSNNNHCKQFDEKLDAANNSGAVNSNNYNRSVSHFFHQTTTTATQQQILCDARRNSDLIKFDKFDVISLYNGLCAELLEEYRTKMAAFVDNSVGIRLAFNRTEHEIKNDILVKFNYNNIRPKNLAIMNETKEKLVAQLECERRVVKERFDSIDKRIKQQFECVLSECTVLYDNHMKQLIKQNHCQSNLSNKSLFDSRNMFEQSSLLVHQVFDQKTKPLSRVTYTKQYFIKLNKAIDKLEQKYRIFFACLEKYMTAWRAKLKSHHNNNNICDAADRQYLADNHVRIKHTLCADRAIDDSELLELLNESLDYSFALIERETALIDTSEHQLRTNASNLALNLYKKCLHSKLKSDLFEQNELLVIHENLMAGTISALNQSLQSNNNSSGGDTEYLSGDCLRRVEDALNSEYRIAQNAYQIRVDEAKQLLIKLSKEAVNTYYEKINAIIANEEFTDKYVIFYKFAQISDTYQTEALEYARQQTDTLAQYFTDKCVRNLITENEIIIRNEINKINARILIDFNNNNNNDNNSSIPAFGSTMRSLTPHLIFRGNCREVMQFYKQCIGGELFFTPYGERVPEHQEEIVYSTLSFDGKVFLEAYDSIEPTPPPTEANVALSVACDTEQELRDQFALLSDGGVVKNAIAKQYWGEIFGRLKDKFGTDWMLSYKPVESS